jgi:hypothetical protein
MSKTEFKTVEVFNKSARTFHYADVDADGKVFNGEITPNTKKPMGEEAATKLCAMYPKDLSITGDITLVDTSAPALKAEKLGHDVTKDELKKAQETITALKNELSAVKGQKTKAENELKKLKAAADKE